MTSEEILKKVSLGMTREEVKSVLGEPDDMGGTSRKYRTPAIYKYGDTELHFAPWKTGELASVYREDKDGTPHTLLGGKGYETWKKMLEDKKLSPKKVDRIAKYIEAYFDDRKYSILNFHNENLHLMLKAKGSSHNHQAWEGGYYDHISECFLIAHRMWKTFEHRQLPFTFANVLTVLYFHDVEKIWKYTKGLPDGFNKETFFLTCPDQYGFGLQVRERRAIHYIHGEGNDYSGRRRVMGRLGAFCHAVDVLSARLWFDRPARHNYLMNKEVAK